MQLQGIIWERSDAQGSRAWQEQGCCALRLFEQPGADSRRCLVRDPLRERIAGASPGSSAAAPSDRWSRSSTSPWCWRRWSAAACAARRRSLIGHERQGRLRACRDFFMRDCSARLSNAALTIDSIVDNVFRIFSISFSEMELRNPPHFCNGLRYSLAISGHLVWPTPQWGGAAQCSAPQAHVRDRGGEGRVPGAAPGHGRHARRGPRARRRGAPACAPEGRKGQAGYERGRWET